MVLSACVLGESLNFSIGSRHHTMFGVLYWGQCVNGCYLAWMSLSSSLTSVDWMHNTLFSESAHNVGCTTAAWK